MNTRKVATEYRLSQWAQLMGQRTASGQSIKDFCENAGISRNTYFYWHRTLRQAACYEIADKSVGAEASLVPGGLARLEPAASMRSPASVSVETNGYRVEVTGATDPDLFVRVCRTLKTL